MIQPSSLSSRGWRNHWSIQIKYSYHSYMKGLCSSQCSACVYLSEKGHALFSLDCPFSIVPSVFSNVYENINKNFNLSSHTDFSGVRVTRSFVFGVCFVDRCMSFSRWVFYKRQELLTIREHLGVFRFFFDFWFFPSTANKTSPDLNIFNKRQ